jgi:hypothetical protein
MTTSPPSPRDQLEATVRRQLTRIAATFMQVGIVTAILNEATDTILAAADTYASAEVGLLTPAERRAVLSAALEGHPHD